MNGNAGNMAVNGIGEKGNLRQFQQNVQNLLSEQEKYYFSYSLKDYKTYKSVEKLVRSLSNCLNTQEKRQLLKYVRNFVLPSQQEKFDALTESCGIPKSKSQGDSQVYMNGEQKDLSVPKYRVVSLINDKVNDIDLGFRVCGGKEFGVGIYVSNVIENSPSFNAGLRKNDHIIEVNGISLQNIPLQSAANLFASLSKLKIVAKEEVKSGIICSANNINPWSTQVKHVDEADGNLSNQDEYMVEQEVDVRKANIALRRSSKILNVDEKNNERRVQLIIPDSSKEFIGFNIRGGSDYGLGIYVSSVDSGSVADECGLRIGDQILDANGKDFENILHEDAVDFLKSNNNIVLTVKAVGRIPEDKCYIEEYSWLNADGTAFTNQVSKETEYLSSSMPVIQTNNHRDFATDASELPWNQTINLPPGSSDVLKEVTHDQPEECDDEAKIKETLLTKEEWSEVSDKHDEEDAELRRSPSATSLVSKKSSDSGKSDRGMRLSEHSDSSKDDISNLLSVSKAKRSKSFLQKQGDKLKAKFSFRMKKKSAKMNLFDSELFQKADKRTEWLQYIDDKAKERLTVTDYKALMNHIKQYLEKGDIELFTSNALEILDTPGKSLLLKDVRTIIFPYDIGRFDAKVSKREMDIMIAHGRDPIESPILDVEISEKPPKKTLITAVHDKSGKFQLKSKSEAERLEKEREENSKRVSKKYIQQRSILERETTIQRFQSFSNVPRPSRQHTESWSHDPDDIQNDLDLIPTKDTPRVMEELYAKVDKSRPVIAKDGIVVKEMFEIPVIIKEGEKKSLQHLMSDIDEDDAYSVPVVQQKNVNKSAANDIDDDEDGDADDYSKIDSLHMKREIKNVSINVKKDNKTLGISISGGKGSTQQPEIRIERVYPGGAVDEAGTIKAGHQILSIDGESLTGVTHNEAVDIIRKSFSNKTKPLMEMTVLLR